MSSVEESAQDFNEVVKTIRRDDPRYAQGAYYFLRHALDYTFKKMHKQGRLANTHHVTGQQLLEGVRDYALEQYGPLAREVLEQWGITCCRDFGNIVFNLVECHVLGKTEEDKPEDFDGVFDFDEAFEQPFRPSWRPERTT